MSDTSSNKGFTLLEILIAITLLAVVATSLYASYFTISKARERASAGIESRRELGSTLDLIRKECASAIYRRDDKDKRFKFVVEDRDYFGSPASNFELSTIPPASAVDRKSSGVTTVKYSIFDKEQDGKKRILTRLLYDPLFDAKDAKPYPQIENIKSFLVECYDGSKWVKTWDSSVNNRLPSIVKITVMVDENGSAKEFSVIAPVKVTAI